MSRHGREGLVSVLLGREMNRVFWLEWRIASWRVFLDLLRFWSKVVANVIRVGVVEVGVVGGWRC
jgi:hypothetical protein